MKVKKGLVSKFILEKLAEAGELAIDGLFPPNRVEGRIWRELFDLPADYVFSKRNISIRLSQLKNQGLVKRGGSKRYATWSLTGQGDKKVRTYQIEPVPSDGIPRLVMYDIPEIDRRKRDLLRSELVACQYQQLQKSVWLGYCPLPEEFIENLKSLGLKGKVHIVGIDRKGTLTEF